jgi:hypothetical protein
MFEAADGGRTGAVTDRFMTIPDGKGEGVGEGVREDCRHAVLEDVLGMGVRRALAKQKSGDESCCHQHWQ